MAGRNEAGLDGRNVLVVREDEVAEVREPRDGGSGGDNSRNVSDVFRLGSPEAGQEAVGALEAVVDGGDEISGRQDRVCEAVGGSMAIDLDECWRLCDDGAGFRGVCPVHGCDLEVRAHSRALWRSKVRRHVRKVHDVRSWCTSLGVSFVVEERDGALASRLVSALGWSMCSQCGSCAAAGGHVHGRRGMCSGLLSQAECGQSRSLASVLSNAAIGTSRGPVAETHARAWSIPDVRRGREAQHATVVGGTPVEPAVHYRMENAEGRNEHMAVDEENGPRAQGAHPGPRLGSMALDDEEHKEDAHSDPAPLLAAPTDGNGGSDQGSLRDVEVCLGQTRRYGGFRMHQELEAKVAEASTVTGVAFAEVGVDILAEFGALHWGLGRAPRLLRKERVEAMARGLERSLQEIVIAAGLDVTPDCTSERLCRAWKSFFEVVPRERVGQATPARADHSGGEDVQGTLPMQLGPTRDYPADEWASQDAVIGREALLQRAARLVQEGRVSDAASTLLSPTPPLSPGPREMVKLSALHPRAAPIPDSALQEWDSMVKEAPGGQRRPGAARQGVHGSSGRGPCDEVSMAQVTGPWERAREAVRSVAQNAAFSDRKDLESRLQRIYEGMRQGVVAAGAQQRERRRAAALGRRVGEEEGGETALQWEEEASAVDELLGRCGVGDYSLSRHLAQRQGRVWGRRTHEVVQPRGVAGGRMGPRQVASHLRRFSPVVVAERLAAHRAASRRAAGQVPWVSSGFVKKVLCGMPRHRAVGPSGQSYEFLAQIAGCSAYAQELMASLIRLWMLGRAGPACLLMQGRLVALDKRDGRGGLRPIVLGECFGRVAAQVLLRAGGSPEGEELAEGGQFAVGVSGGTEVMGWAAQMAHARGASLLALDVRNAYNEVSREQVLSACAR